MRFPILLALVMACASPPHPAYLPVPEAGVEGDRLREAFRRADLVVLGTPDAMEAEGGLSSGIFLIGSDHWWNHRIRVEAVAKGKLKAANRMDYGEIPAMLSPPRPFTMDPDHIMAQSGSRWSTAPITTDVRAIYFLEKCWYCVTVQYGQARYRANPWFAILVLSPDQWNRVLEARGAK